MDMLKNKKVTIIGGGGVGSSTLAKSVCDILALKQPKCVAYVPELNSIDMPLEEGVKCVEYNPNMGIIHVDERRIRDERIGGGVGKLLIGCEELVNVIDEAQENATIVEKLNFSNEKLSSVRDNVEFEITRIPRITDSMFFPKAKHLPKGHQRPYKFHK
jgi:hypothetical protein